MIGIKIRRKIETVAKGFKRVAVGVCIKKMDTENERRII